MSDPFANLPRNHYGAILADPPWHFQAWAGERRDGAGRISGARAPDYPTMRENELAKFPVGDLAAENCVLFMWMCWPTLEQSLRLLSAWGFTYKTCAFSWIKANATQIDMFREDIEPRMNLGYWTRANSEACLLATRGKPKRLNADVRQAIVELGREHSRKPDCIHGRIQRLVAGPYLELFARAPRSGWDVWGNQTDKFAEAAE
jgi:N6-adenosine-specific RNA methylase IME4